MPARLPSSEQQQRRKLLLADLRAGVAALTASGSTPSSASAAATASLAGASEAAAAPHYHPPSSSVSSTPSPERLKQLRVALEQALLSCAPATPPPQQRQQQQQQRPLGEPRTPPPLSGQAAAAAVNVGCFGGGGQPARLTWNLFQRACKGRGMSKPQISAAYATAKASKLATQAEVVSFLDAWLQQQQEAGADAATTTTSSGSGAGAWGAVKQWACSRAASRGASRAASRVTSPDTSPAAATAAAGGRSRGSADHGEAPPAAGPWGALKRWAHSRSSSRAASRRATPAASPNQANAAPPERQPAAAARLAADVPFAAQLDLGSTTPGAQQQQLDQHPQPVACRNGGVRWVGRRMARETLPDDHPLLRGFGPWHPVDPDNLKQLKAAVPALPGVYEWGLRPASAASAGGKPQQRVLAVYCGKAGTLRRAHLARRTAPHGYRGETLRTRFNKYALTKARRVGPVREPHKDAMFAAHLAAGDRLCIRWWAVGEEGPEPSDIELQLLGCFDFAFNFQNNRDRRRLLLPAAEE